MGVVCELCVGVVCGSCVGVVWELCGSCVGVVCWSGMCVCESCLSKNVLI